MQNGTYVPQLVEETGKYAAATYNSDQSKFSLVNDSRSDSAKVRVFNSL